MIDANWLSNLKKFDCERYDSLKRLNSENRKELGAIYSFNLELANIAWNISEPELGYLKLRWWEDYVNDMNKEKPIEDNEYLLILSKLVAEEKLHRKDLLRLVKAREFDCSKKPFDNHEQQVEYIRDTSQNLLFMGLSCLTEFNDLSIRKSLSEYFGLSLGLARFILAAGSLSQNKCYSLFFPARSDYKVYFEYKLSESIIERVHSEIDFVFQLIERGDKKIKNIGIKKNSLHVLNTVQNCLPILKEIRNNPQLIFRKKHKLRFSYKLIGKIKELVT